MFGKLSRRVRQKQFGVSKINTEETNNFTLVSVSNCSICLDTVILIMVLSLFLTLT